jgi:hypothetical protein
MAGWLVAGHLQLPRLRGFAKRCEFLAAVAQSLSSDGGPIGEVYAEL